MNAGADHSAPLLLSFSFPPFVPPYECREEGNRAARNESIRAIFISQGVATPSAKPLPAHGCLGNSIASQRYEREPSRKITTGLPVTTVIAHNSTNNRVCTISSCFLISLWAKPCWHNFMWHKPDQTLVF